MAKGSSSGDRLSPVRLKRADAFIARKIDEGVLPGAVTCVHHRGELVHLNIQGWADMENRVSLTGESLFRLYSNTKIIASVAALAVYEEGLYDLNDPVARHLPAFAEQRVRLEDGSLVPAERPTRVYDLLRHCGGLARVFDLEELISSGRTLATMADELAREPLEAQPDTRWIYGYSTDILARVLEVVTGQPFDEILRQRIFEPLGMRDTAFRVGDGDADRFTVLYRRPAEGQLTVADGTGPESLFRRPKTFLSASGGLVSSPSDYLRFALMLLNRGTLDGATVLGSRTVDLMTCDHLPPGHPNLEIGTQSFRFGLGVSTVTDVARTRCLSSPGEFGWGGAAGTQVWINPAEDLVAMIFIQVRAEIPTGIMDAYKRLVYQALVPGQAS